MNFESYFSDQPLPCALVKPGKNVSSYARRYAPAIEFVEMSRKTLQQARLNVILLSMNDLAVLSRTVGKLIRYFF